MDLYDVLREFEIIIGRLERTEVRDFEELFYPLCRECLHVMRHVFYRMSTQMNLDYEGHEEIRWLFARIGWLIGRTGLNTGH